MNDKTNCTINKSNNLNQNIICENFNENVEENNKEKNLFNLSKLTEFIKNSKLGKIKGIKIIGLVIIFCVIVLLFFKFSDSSVNTSNSNINKNNYDFTDSNAYTIKLEDKLQSVLSNISGAGKVSVMVTLKTSPEIILANTTDEKVNSSTNQSNSTSYTTTVTEPIIITSNGSNSALIVKEVLPEVKGVVVVATGANNTNVKLNIIQAVKALLDINMDSIQVFAGV